MKVVVHNGRFHADDVFVVATLRLKFGEAIEVMRTRDESQFADADVVADVGGIYDEAAGRFDHHQPGGAGVRENGVPYASFGLVWKKYGAELCGSPEIALAVDKKLVQPIDAYDNGFLIADPRSGMPDEFNLSQAFKVFLPTWLEGESGYDAAFFDVVAIAERILARVIEHAKARFQGNKLAARVYGDSPDPRLLVLDGPYPFGDFVEEHPEIMFVASPDVFEDRWNLLAVQVEQFKNRLDLPAAWGGLQRDELESLTGVKGAAFCHRGLHFCRADTKEATLALAALALQS